MCVHMCVCAYVRVSICACVHMCVCAYVCVSICACVHMCVCPYVRVCMCAYVAARIFDEVATENGLTLSVPKTKLLVAGLGLTIDDLAPLELDGGVVKVVEQFKYLG